MSDTKSITSTVSARPEWDNKAQFLLTCIGFAVGLGNVWRFPYRLQSSGGGAFLIPYMIMFFVEGVPLLYLELSVGQRLRLGSVGVWNKINRFMGGVGICSAAVSFLVGIYYNTIIAWCIWYLCNSFQEPLPWKSCPVNANGTGYVQECELSSPTQYFWYRNTLQITPAIDESGGIVPHLVGVLVVAWLIVALCVIKGIASAGKVVYFTATFPYIVLLIFLVRGVTLEGAGTGLSYLFTPDISKLSDPNIWLAAATQIFFSLGIAFGGMIAFASYNPLHADVEVNCITVAVINSATSLLACVVIFSILGFKATIDYQECVADNTRVLLDFYDQPEGSITLDSYENFLIEKFGTVEAGIANFNLANCSITDNLDKGASGTGLAFIVFADAILEMPGSQVWAVLFFLMLLTLGLDSMFGNIEGVVTPLHDLGLTKRFRMEWIVVALVGVSFVISLTFIQGSGNYWLDVFDNYAGSIPLLIIAFFELVCVAYLYNYFRFEKDMDEVLPNRGGVFRTILRWYWKITIFALSPLVLLVIFVYYIYNQIINPLTYESWQPELGDNVDTEYPSWVVGISALITLVCTVWIPLVAVYRFFKKPEPELPTKNGVVHEGFEMNEGNKNEYAITT